MTCSPSALLPHRSLGPLALIMGALMLLSCQPDSAALPSVIPEHPDLFKPGLVSTPAYERDLTLHPEESFYVFTRGNADQSRRALVRYDTSGRLSVLPISGVYNDIEPFFNPQGDRLYFASDRPMSATGETVRKDYNIWSVIYKEGQWGAPIPLDTTINTHGNEYYPSVNRVGDLFYTGQYPDGIGREDIYVARKKGDDYHPRQLLDTAINTSKYEFNAYVDPDERFIIFSSYGREDGYGGGDLYISKKMADGQWSSAENLGPEINSSTLDYCPFVTEHAFFYTSELKSVMDSVITDPSSFLITHGSLLNGQGNIFKKSISALPLD